MKSIHKSVTAVVSAFALGALALAVPATALADDAQADTANIKADQTVSLTVHKYAGDPAKGTAHNGTELTGEALPKGDALKGVTFTAAPVLKSDDSKIDLTTNAGWEEAAKAAANAPAKDLPAGYKLGKAKTATTGDTGAATFSDLEKTLYLVTETNIGSNKVTKMAAPFFVTLPLSSEQGWIYNVHVYPKNETSTENGKIEKAVTADAVLNDDGTLAYTVTATIPQRVQYNSVVVTDTPSANLSINQGSLQVKLAKGDAEAAALEKADYEVTGATDGSVTIKLTDAGLAKLATDSANTLTLAYNATLTQVGTFENGATLQVNDEGDGVNTTEKAYYGTITITKTDENGKALAGAEFQISETKDGEAIKAADGSVITLKTDDQGKATSPRLLIGTGDTTQKTFYVKETKAPAGYQLDAEAKEAEFDVAEGKLQVTLTIENEPVTVGGVKLPFTGANGQLLLTIGGVAALLGLAGVTVVAMRRRHA